MYACLFWRTFFTFLCINFINVSVQKTKLFYIVPSLFGQSPSIFCMPGLSLHINYMYYVLFIICHLAEIQIHKQNFYFDFQNTLPFFVHFFFLSIFVFFSRWIKANQTVLYLLCIQVIVCISHLYTTIEYKMLLYVTDLLEVWHPNPVSSFLHQFHFHLSDL